MIDPETLLKLEITGEAAPQDLIDIFHPSQLESRFGGEAETPTVFWPPLMGTTFLRDGDESHLEKIKPSEYEQILQDNPELQRHPALIREKSQNSRDFFTDDERSPVQEVISP